MPAYSFNARFAEPILAGTKGGTIRAPRRPANRGIHSMARQAETGGHARPGEELALYTGMGTKQCRLITRKKCIATDPIALDFLADVVVLHNDSLQRALDLDGFARFDGFRDWSELAAFWRETHGVPEFRGWHICWLPLP